MERDGDGPTPTRRDALRSAGGLLGVLAGASGPVTGRLARPRPGFEGARPRGPGTTAGREDFCWLGFGLWRHDRFRERMLAFARRHGAGVVLGPPPTNAPDVGDALRPALRDAAIAGVQPWVNLGVFREATAAKIRWDDDARERHLAGLREAAHQLGRYVDGGRIVLWQEAPVMGRWTDDGEWTRESVDALLEHGPAVFAAQRDAIRESNPEIDVGIFVHFPYVVDSKQPEVFATLSARLDERDATPDFGFTDFYRGWYEKDAGPDRADAAVRSLVENTREHLGTEVFYLGQPHTINPGHTPSRQAMRSNLRAALEAGADGVGWYARSSYHATTTGFDPFVPNVPDASFDGEPVSTPTVALDRYQYAWSATLESRTDVDPANRFDLWLHGEGFDYEAHRLVARTAPGGWRLLGDVGGTLDGDHPRARERTAILRALPRDRVLEDGRLEVRIETDAAATPRTLHAILAMPWDPTAFVTADRATELLLGPADVGDYELGRVTAGGQLVPGESVTLDLRVADGTRSLTRLADHTHAAAIYRLVIAELAPGFDPDARFDLWLAGSGLSDPARAPGLGDRAGEVVQPTRAGVVAVSSDDVALYYGLKRERFLAGGLRLADEGVTGAQVDKAYAMPYAGSACFRSPETAAALLAEQPVEAATFATDRIER